MKYKISNPSGWLRVVCSPVDWDNDFGAIFNYHNGEKMVCLYEKSFTALASRLPVTMKQQADKYSLFGCNNAEEFYSKCVMLHNLAESENISPESASKIMRSTMRDYFHFDTAFWYTGVPPRYLTPSLQGLVGLYNYDVMKGIDHTTSILILLSTKQIEKAHREHESAKCFVLIIRNMDMMESLSFFQEIFKPEYEKYIPPSESNVNSNSGKSTGCSIAMIIPFLFALTGIASIINYCCFD